MQTENCRFDGRVAEWNPQRKRRRGGPGSIWKDRITNNMQSRNLKNEERLDGQLWRGGGVKKNFKFREIVFTEKFR
jgi:hypothetical protein